MYLPCHAFIFCDRTVIYCFVSAIYKGFVVALNTENVFSNVLQ